jgi:glycosyltransferase involved in cell wall biosynthesis
MPTANRQKFVPFAIQYFLEQTYKNSELIIVDDGIESILPLVPEDPRIKYHFCHPLGTIGTKRNYACHKSIGEIIVQWDDDEWYAADWVSNSVSNLLASEADITGLELLTYYSPI